MTALLDGNVLISLTDSAHVHHDAARAWFGALSEDYATCPITQGTLLRGLLRQGSTSEEAMIVLGTLTGRDRHQFWPAAMGYAEVELAGVVGHRQVTDAYLAALARHHGGTVATFDEGLAALHPDVAVLVTP